MSKEEETDSESDSVQIDEPSCSGVRKAATSPLSEEDNLLCSDDDQADRICVDKTYLPSSNTSVLAHSEKNGRSECVMK